MGVAQKLESGEASPEHFGGFVGMVCLEPGKLAGYMHMNHWFVVRPPSTWVLPPQGWGGIAQGPAGNWWDDRCWDPWRSVFSNLGGEFHDWATVDWAALARGGGFYK